MNQSVVYDAIKQARPQDIFAELCSRGFGKTMIGSTLGLEGIRQEEPGNVIMLSSSLKKQRLLVQPKFDYLLQDCPPPFQPIHHSQDNYYTDPITGNNLYLCAAERKRINDIRGIHNVKLCLIDEAAFFGAEEDSYPLDYVIEAIITPMFLHSKNARVIVYSTPPEVPNHPFKELYEDAVLRGSFAKHTIYESGLTPAQIEEQHQRIKDPIIWRREQLCEFVIDDNLMIVPEFSYDKHVREVLPPPYYPMLYKGSGADLGVSDKTVEIFGYYDFQRHKVVIKKEFWLQGAEVRTDIFAERHQAALEELRFDLTAPGEQHPRVGFYSDNSNLMLINDLNQLHHITIIPTEKEKKAEWLNLIRIMFKNGEIEIDPSCQLLIMTLQGGYWKDALHSDYARTKPLGHMDAIDTLIYFIRNLNRTTNPFPADYGFSHATHVYPPGWNVKARTNEGRALQKVFSKDRFNPKTFRRPVIGGL